MSDLGVFRPGQTIVSSFQTLRNELPHDYASNAATATLAPAAPVALTVTDLGVGINSATYVVPLDAVPGTLVITWTAGPTASGGVITGTDVATIVAAVTPAGDSAWCTLERARVIAGNAAVSGDDLAVAQAFVQIMVSPVLPGDPLIQASDLPLLETAVGRQAGAAHASAGASGGLAKLAQLRSQIGLDGLYDLDGERAKFGTAVRFRDQIALDPLAELALSRLSWLAQKAFSVVATRQNPFLWGTRSGWDSGAREVITSIPYGGY